MAFDEGLAERLREIFQGRQNVVEKKMFGGVAFMVNGNMCVGITGNILMARVGPDQHEMAMKKPHARKMDFTGKSMKGFVYVDPEGYAEDDDLKKWVELCEKFVLALPAR